ncbi:aminopeptidase P family protein [Pedobacter changchengzhani]|uniref:Aminopeptidase P family protein n=1 Tax=Pedobacter changchengzhani TaxID=2529274 RepID=A0A4R5MN21_9SPHI|nr:aminopeptidase P family protein [Pedobacter changchengzhani]TDG37028.1 aminopeptidase P family protein [Pedobacter changchengzhani]
MNYTEKLSAIRKLMLTEGIDAYIIPSADPHLSEYLPDFYKCIEFVTGFTGSVSTVVITQNFAGLWADFRYFEQAEAELKGSGFELVKLNIPHTPQYIDWLKEQLTNGSVIGFDENLVSIIMGEMLIKQLASKQINFKHCDCIDPIWENRPPLPTANAYLLGDEVTGESMVSKLTAIRSEMKKSNTSHHLISSLDDIAWVFNLRGSDVKYNPIALSFALIDENQTTLYIDAHKLSAIDAEKLTNNGVNIAPYIQVGNDLQKIASESAILIDPKRTCSALYKSINNDVKRVLQINPSTNFKAVKNDLEISNTRKSMVKDGVAMTQFFKWIKENVNKIEITELSAAKKLEEFRAAQIGFVGESFNTIAGYKAHGALPHYATTAISDAKIEAEGLFLVDSGGQYHYGTTDITRVIPLGNNTEEEKTDYTLVLKAMIEGSKTRFPKGTCGYQIDAITRRPMWEHGLNFGHGTGHGVGYFLNVHEGPQTINASAIPVSMDLGMITSIEPGIYRTGKHGIRIENLVLTIADECNEFNQFYAFETLTLAPIDTTLVKKELLEQSQIEWLNNYHTIVYDRISPFLNEEEKAFLKVMTTAI